jgi:hypothetical protein
VKCAEKPQKGQPFEKKKKKKSSGGAATSEKNEYFGA